jgi:hypothetical protein
MKCILLQKKRLCAEYGGIHVPAGVFKYLCYESYHNFFVLLQLSPNIPPVVTTKLVSVHWNDIIFKIRPSVTNKINNKRQMHVGRYGRRCVPSIVNITCSKYKYFMIKINFVFITVIYISTRSRALPRIQNMEVWLFVYF